MNALRAFVATVGVLAAFVSVAQPVPNESLQRLVQRAEAERPLRVLIGVRLSEPYRPEGELDSAQVAAQRHRIATAQDAVAESIGRLGGRTTTRYRFVPHLAAEVPAAALNALLDSPLVAGVSEDRLRRPTLLRSTALIGAEQAWRSGLTGAGWTVALPDTGVDANHPFLAGKVVAEACDSSTFSGNGAQPATVSLCPGGAAQSTAVGAGRPCDSNLADCEHGTHVAGIVGGRNGPDGLSGVAPDASLVALQIHSRLAEGSGIAAWDSDLLKALERVYDLSGEQRIAAVNLSLAGEDLYSDPLTCDAAQPAVKPPSRAASRASRSASWLSGGSAPPPQGASADSAAAVDQRRHALLRQANALLPSIVMAGRYRRPVCPAPRVSSTRRVGDASE